MKRILIAVLLALLSLVTILQQQDQLTASAQQPKAFASPVASPGKETAPAPLPAETLLKIRDLQLADANRKLKMQTLESDYQKLQDEQKADGQRLSEIIAEAAKAAGIDLAKYVFALDQSKFVPRPAPSPSPSK